MRICNKTRIRFFKITTRIITTIYIFFLLYRKCKGVNLFSVYAGFVLRDTKKKINLTTFF